MTRSQYNAIFGMNNAHPIGVSEEDDKLRAQVVKKVKEEWSSKQDFPDPVQDLKDHFASRKVVLAAKFLSDNLDKNNTEEEPMEIKQQILEGIKEFYKDLECYSTPESKDKINDLWIKQLANIDVTHYIADKNYEGCYSLQGWKIFLLTPTHLISYSISENGKGIYFSSTLLKKISYWSFSTELKIEGNSTQALTVYIQTNMAEHIGYTVSSQSEAFLEQFSILTTPQE